MILNKYFKDDWEFPTIQLIGNLSENILYENVSYKYLNGIANIPLFDGGHIVCSYLLDRYTPPTQLIQCGIMLTQKLELFRILIGGDVSSIYRDLRTFQDDILLIEKMDTQSNQINKYLFLWFDYDISDCQVGIFTTDDTEQQIQSELLKFLEQSKGQIWQNDVSFNYHKIPNPNKKVLIQF